MMFRQDYNLFTRKSMKSRETGPLATRVGRVKPPCLEKQVCEVGYRR